MVSLKRVFLVVLLITLFSMVSVSYAADPPLPTPVGRVVWVKGTLKATMENNEQRILQKMSVVYLHDVLTTDATSQAQIVFTDESLMTFYPNTKFSIDKYVYEQKKKGVGSYVMSLIEGGFRTITGLIAKNNPSDYRVNTPVATIGVRGTDYAVYLKTNGELYVGRYQGKPCVSGKKQGSEVCLNNTSAQYAYVQNANSAPVPVNQQPGVFNEKLEVVPFNISPFSSPAAQGRGPARSGGPITSFCISQ